MRRIVVMRVMVMLVASAVGAKDLARMLLARVVCHVGGVMKLDRLVRDVRVRGVVKRVMSGIRLLPMLPMR
jgi:hypothetical protein